MPIMSPPLIQAMLFRLSLWNTQAHISPVGQKQLIFLVSYAQSLIKQSPASLEIIKSVVRNSNGVISLYLRCSSGLPQRPFTFCLYTTDSACWVLLHDFVKYLILIHQNSINTIYRLLSVQQIKLTDLSAWSYTDLTDRLSINQALVPVVFLANGLVITIVVLHTLKPWLAWKMARHMLKLSRWKYAHHLSFIERKHC